MSALHTPNLGLPYPDPSDPADVPFDVGALATALDTLPSMHAPGDLIVSAAAARAGCLLCDGAAVSRTTYASLFAAIGTAYGVGDGGTTFNLPDFRGRALVGAGAGPGLTARALGDKLGEETHQLTTAELATHNHGVNDPGHGHGVSDPTHGHSIADSGHGHGQPPGMAAWTCSTPSGSPPGRLQYTASGGLPIDSGYGTAASGTGIGIYGASTGVTIQNRATGLTIQNSGSNTRHNNMPPIAVANVFIKT
jgi:microcystin-dependent protein